MNEDAGITVHFHVEWNEEEGEAQYSATYSDPNIDTVVYGLVRLIEASFGWGCSREQIIYKIKDALLEVEGM